MLSVKLNSMIYTRGCPSPAMVVNQDQGCGLLSACAGAVGSRIPETNIEYLPFLLLCWVVERSFGHRTQSEIPWRTVGLSCVTFDGM
jgi:hypothetical protein